MLVSTPAGGGSSILPVEFVNPPREFSVMPFWFWNDALEPDAIIRQIGEFERHGVFGFVLHPRVGLPRDLGWMSDALLDLYEIALQEARRRGMYVYLYDEGMYPSGSSSGQVVARNPIYACRCLEARTGAHAPVSPGETLVARVRAGDGRILTIVDRPARTCIRGLHYVGEGPEEDEPPAADLLNPAAVATFLDLVQERFAERFGRYFGSTIPGIFTDEPGLLGRGNEPGIQPGTTGILTHVNRILGFDFEPHLAALWEDDDPKAGEKRQWYHRAIRHRLEETYYQPLSQWCEAHGIALTGHPGQGDEIGPLRYFQIPGQDLVWRWVLPDSPTALEGPESTQAKCSASAALHAGRRRNANECCGAYGHELTWEEMCWLACWCFLRGVNLLFPHAFYYSVRGPRGDERPPDVGPHSPWWDRYPLYADFCRRISWLNTDASPICTIAILGRSDTLPWKTARLCFEHQFDFHYVEDRDLTTSLEILPEGFRVGGHGYRLLVVEDSISTQEKDPILPDNLTATGRIVRYRETMDDADFLSALNRLTVPVVRTSTPTPALRARHLRKAGMEWILLWNERRDPLECKIEMPLKGTIIRVDPWSAKPLPSNNSPFLRLAGHEMAVFMASPAAAPVTTTSLRSVPEPSVPHA